MAWIDIELEPLLSRRSKPQSPVISFSKNGRITLMPKASELIGLRDGDGISFGYNDESKGLYLIVDNKSPCRVTIKGKSKFLAVQAQKLNDHLRTYLKVTHDKLFKVKVNEPPVRRGDKEAYLLTVLK